MVSKAKPSQLKHELSKALGTRDDKVAKRAAAATFVWADEIVQRGLIFLKEGPKATLSRADRELMADRYGAELITGDLELRKAGIGLNLAWPNPLTIGPPLPPPEKEPGLTDDDLGLLKSVVDKMGRDLKGASARQRPPQFIKDAVQEALLGAGIALPEGSPDRRELELAFLRRRMEALDATAARNAGQIVASPSVTGRIGGMARPKRAERMWLLPYPGRQDQVSAWVLGQALVPAAARFASTAKLITSSCFRHGFPS